MIFFTYYDSIIGAHANVSMSALCLVGGFIGYHKSKSVPSLVVGSLLSGVYGYSAYEIQQGSMISGHLIGAGASSITAYLFAVRYLRTKKFMPAGLLATSAGFVGTYNLKKYHDWSN